MKNLIKHPKHFIRMPIYWQQAKQVKRHTPRLPEALPLETQARHGSLPFVSNEKSGFTDTDISDIESSESKPVFNLMITGDSSAAGVGVDYQSQALMGRLLFSLFNHALFARQYKSIDWQLHATKGHDSFDVLRRLYVLPSAGIHLDVLIVVVGVNDVTKMQSRATWQNNLNEIVKVANHKFSPKHILFTAIPPMVNFPAMPSPLNELVDKKARELDEALQGVCSQLPQGHHVPFRLQLDSVQANEMETYFASDGFHPSAWTYQIWAETLSETILSVMLSDNILRHEKIA